MWKLKHSIVEWPGQNYTAKYVEKLAQKLTAVQTWKQLENNTKPDAG